VTDSAAGSKETGLLGPVALYAGVLLLAISPLMRGGNRHAALMVLEGVAITVLLALGLRTLSGVSPWSIADRRSRYGFGVLVLSPLLLAFAQLLPLPPAWWGLLAGHGIYLETLNGAGVSTPSWRPISVGPAATASSLLAGIPLACALLLGYLASLRQLRLILRVVVCVAFAQLALGLLQVAGGEHSWLYFGADATRPVGTFANSNHYGNYIAMSLAAFLWLVHEGHGQVRHGSRHGLLTGHNQFVVSLVGGLALVLGVLISLSRGATMFGLGSAALALVAVLLRLRGPARGWLLAVVLAAVVVLASVAIIGVDLATSRSSAREWAGSAAFRTTLMRTTLDGAMAFWPWGSGWGTYDQVYPRFQPAEISGFANHAHQDYLEMLFEGGIFFVVLAIVFLWLAGRRAWELAAGAIRHRTLDRESMAAAVCGLGLLGLLLHSLVDFNMRIPANAILGSLLAGVFLRPLVMPRPPATLEQADAGEAGPAPVRMNPASPCDAMTP
jgi:O-antigen ligase